MTCPGHAAISTGTNANKNGIVGNNWFDVSAGAKVYCCEDATVQLLGSRGAGRSPTLLMSPTVGDILKKAAPSAKVFGVAGKDRSATMLAGHRADAAYWLQDSLFITSTFYLASLPDWVESFNARRLPQSMHDRIWDRVLPAAVYDSTVGPDDFWNEEDRNGLGKTFPKTISGGSPNFDKDYYEALRKSPFDDEIVLEFAMELIDREEIGVDSVTDLLGISFSSIDRIGHPYGPDSHEIMDDVIRVDRVLARLFEHLDKRIGLDNIVIVLTADHGVQRMPELVADPVHGVSAGRVSSAYVRSTINDVLTAAFGEPTSKQWVAEYYYPHVYLSREALAERSIDLNVAVDTLAMRLPRHEQFDSAFTPDNLSDVPELFSNFPGRSGDLFVRLADHHIDRTSEFGTTHGTVWEGDRHVPMLWYGRNVKAGTISDPANVIDLAPTLLHAIGLPPDEGMDGNVLRPAFVGD